MLDDLEERQARLAGDEDAVLEGLSAVSDQNFHTVQRRRKRIVIGCLLVISASLLVYLMSPIQISPSEYTKLFRQENTDTSLTSEVTNNNITTSEIIPVQSNVTDNSNIAIAESMPAQIEVADESEIPDLDAYLGDLRSKLLPEVPERRYSESDSAPSSEPAVINHILTEADRFSSNITIQLSREVDYQVYPLTDPNRIVVELDDYLTLPADFTRSIDNGLIQAVRGHHEQDYWTIIVLDVTDPVTVDSSEIIRNDSAYDLTIAIIASNDIAEVIVPEPRESDNQISAQSAETVPVSEPEQQPPSFNRVIVSADDIYKKGLQLYRMGRVKEGLDQIMRAVNLDSNHIQARTTLVTYLVDQGNQNLAMELLREGLELDPRQFDWAQLKAHLLIERNDVNGAVKTLQAELPDIQINPEYHAFLAALLQRQNRHEEAVKYYRGVVQIRQNNGIWWMGLGISLEKMKQVQDANDAYEKALNDNSLSSELRGYINRRIMVISRY